MEDTKEFRFEALDVEMKEPRRGEGSRCHQVAGRMGAPENC